MAWVRTLDKDFCHIEEEEFRYAMTCQVLYTQNLNEVMKAEIAKDLFDKLTLEQLQEIEKLWIK